MQAPAIADRKFGWQFGIGLTVVSLIGLWRGWWQWLVLGLTALALIHFVLAWLAPSVLGPINRGWMALGHLLGKIVAPVVLTVMYTVLFVPIALLMRLRGRDELLLRDRSGESFWVVRDKQQIAAESFRNQY